MELSKIVQESVESAKNTIPQEILGAMEHRGFYDAGKYLDDDVTNPVIRYLISSQISLLEAELERKKGMMKNITRDNYDGDDLNSAREYYGIWAITWDEIIRYEDGQSKVLEEDITYLTEQIAEIKKTNL